MNAMSAEFSEIPIEELCTKVTSGLTPLRSRSDFYENGTIDWYKTGELNDWYLEPAKEKIAERALKETSIKIFPVDTVLMAMYGDGKTITSMGMLRSPAATNQACAAMFVDREKCHPRYFFYALKSRRELLLKIASGGAQRNLSGKLMKEFRLPVPRLHIQQRIADILSAYDELIENSQRRIKILEAMARSLYREWFVHFRFPGHENHPLVASALGEIPEGWNLATLGELIKSHIGGGWGKDESGDVHSEPAWVLRGTDIPDARHSQFEGVPHRFHTVSNLRSRKLKVGDIVFEVSGGSKGQPVGRSLLITSELLSGLDGDVICASFCKRIEPDPSRIGSELLYLSFVEGYNSGEIEQYQVQSTGISNFKWTDYISNTRRAVPPKSLQEQFRKQVEPIFKQVSTIGLTIQNLRRTRDLLLPRLLSGQINLMDATS